MVTQGGTLVTQGGTLVTQGGTLVTQGGTMLKHPKEGTTTQRGTMLNTQRRAFWLQSREDRLKHPKKGILLKPTRGRFETDVKINISNKPFKSLLKAFLFLLNKNQFVITYKLSQQKIHQNMKKIKGVQMNQPVQIKRGVQKMDTPNITMIGGYHDR